MNYQLCALAVLLLATGSLPADAKAEPPAAQPVPPAQPAPAAQPEPVDRWAPFRPFLGSWEGTSTGQAGKGKVRREYRLILGDKYLEVRNTATYEAQEANPKGEVHQDFGFISWDKIRKSFVLRQFHGEGFVITYLVEVTPDGIFFTSEAIENTPAGFRAREAYRREEGKGFIELFELAAPGVEFEIYSESRLSRLPD
jgi:hypothetical protein